jgi:hypothetical protein
LRIAGPPRRAIELQVGAGFSKLLARILRHPHTHDAKIGSLHTLLPHLPPLIEQPAFGQLRIANELRKRGLTASCRVLNEVPPDFGCTTWASGAGASGRLTACSETRRLPETRWQRRVGPRSSRLLRLWLKVSNTNSEIGTTCLARPRVRRFSSLTSDVG